MLLGIEENHPWLPDNSSTLDRGLLEVEVGFINHYYRTGFSEQARPSGAQLKFPRGDLWPCDGQGRVLNTTDTRGRRELVYYLLSGRPEYFPTNFAYPMIEGVQSS